MPDDTIGNARLAVVEKTLEMHMDMCDTRMKGLSMAVDMIKTGQDDLGKALRDSISRIHSRLDKLLVGVVIILLAVVGAFVGQLLWPGS